MTMLPRFTGRPPIPQRSGRDCSSSRKLRLHCPRLLIARLFNSLSDWGNTKLGAVTGGNQYFALSPARVKELGLSRRDLVRVSPPGSSHLRGLELSPSGLAALSRAGEINLAVLSKRATLTSGSELRRGRAGQRAGVNQAYKCKVRSPWYKVPLLAVPDLFLTCMNADTPRLTTKFRGGPPPQLDSRCLSTG